MHASLSRQIESVRGGGTHRDARSHDAHTGASGEYGGKHVDIEDVFVGAMHAATGALSVDEVVEILEELGRGAVRCCNTPPVAGTPGSSDATARGPAIRPAPTSRTRRSIVFVGSDPRETRGSL